MMMLNLFIAVVLEGFSSTNKEHTGVVTSQHYNEFIEKWTFYDEEASGWIKLEDLIFLIYELQPPIGKKNEFDQDIRNFLEEEENYIKNRSKIVDQSKRFVVKIEKNMIVPFKKAMKLLVKLQIPVYSDIPG